MTSGNEEAKGLHLVTKHHELRERYEIAYSCYESWKQEVQRAANKERTVSGCTLEEAHRKCEEAKVEQEAAHVAHHDALEQVLAFHFSTRAEPDGAQWRRARAR